MLCPMKRPSWMTTVFTAPSLARIRGDLVQVVQDQLLARVGDVQPVETHPVGALQQVTDGGAGKAQLVEVDGAVQVPEALDVAFAFMHVGRE